MLPYLFGEHNVHLNHLADALSVEITSRGNVIAVSGAFKSVDLAEEVLHMLWEKLQRKQEVTTQEINAALRFLKGEPSMPKNSVNEKKSHKKDHKKSKSSANEGHKPSKHMLYEENAGLKTSNSKLISPRSPNQALYIDTIKTHDMVFGVGPAGTGKTFLAVAAAVQMYQAGEIERMVFCRPAVEAGEKLGFLPGDMLEKIDPYLRPIYDALDEMMPGEDIPALIEKGKIEIAPLAFMRGRTLKNAFVVLDEAQNTTTMQMKMFLTRMGEGTRMVITGDPSQIDLPPGTHSGLKEAMSILSHVDEVPFIHFDAKDVVRHKLVTKIIEAYDKHDFRSRG